MKSVIFVILSILLTCASCSNKPKEQGSSPNEAEADSISAQLLIDSLLTTLKWDDNNSHLKYLRLNGHISKVEYSIEGEGFFLPFEIINFNEEGSIISIFKGEKVYNSILEDNSHQRIIRLGVEDAGLGMVFNMTAKGNESIFENYDEMGSTQFTFSRDTNDRISHLSILYKYYPDMESDECEESKTSYNVQVNSCDSLGNWTSITCSSKDRRVVVIRKFKYIDDPDLIKSININSEKRIVCKFPIESGGFNLRMYNSNSDKWQILLPPPYEDEVFGYKDYRLVGNNLYLIFNTGNNYADASCGVYLYNIKDCSWIELDMGGEDCEFIGNRIKIPHYEIVKYGDCSANNEYNETTNWIDLK